MKFARRDRTKVQMKGKRMMPSFKNPVEKARWVLQHANVRPRKLCTNFTKTEEKKVRMRAMLGSSSAATGAPTWRRSLRAWCSDDDIPTGECCGASPCNA